jgi:flagellar motor switch protein FliM
MDDNTQDPPAEEINGVNESDKTNEVASDAVENNIENQPTLAAEEFNLENLSAKNLEQEDVDALFEKPAVEEKSKKALHGLAAILESGQIYSERFPMLDVLYDRLVRLLSTTLRNFTGDNVEVSCSRMMTTRFGDYLNEIPLPAILSVFQAVEWDNHGVLVLDNKIIYAIIDVLLGSRGKGVASNLKFDGRPNTAIERSLVEKLTTVILNDFSEAFAPITPIEFKYERLETNPRFAAVALEKNAVLLVTFHIEMEDRKGHFDIVLPYATIEPVREILLQNFMGEKFGRDNIWEGHLADRLWDAELNIDASLPPEEFSLGEILDWQEGSQIILSSTMQSPIHLKIAGYELMVGRLGQKNGHVAVKVNEILFGKFGEIS